MNSADLKTLTKEVITEVLDEREEQQAELVAQKAVELFFRTVNPPKKEGEEIVWK